MAALILIQNLMDMGFSQERAQIAVAATDCAGIQPALEWLLKDENERPGTSASLIKVHQIGQKESSVVTKHLLVDPSWELLDPTPDIHLLFVSFSKDFFWDKLGGVQVKWSSRMTSCAGICSFKPKSRECIISLSQPLLSLRPRKDLVETLLHEMIHAFLFLDSGTTDREGHGEQFHFHMYRINKKSGTNITVYHSFNDEVSHYRTHWWKCDGPCQHKPPYFGVVKRAMNRAPGPADSWYEQHKRECGGTYVKVREPEKDERQGSKRKPSQGTSKNKPTVLSPTSTNVRKITEFFPGTPKKSPEESGTKPNAIHTIFPDRPAMAVDNALSLVPRSNSVQTGDGANSAASLVPNSIRTGTGSNSSFSSGSGYQFPGVGRQLNEDSGPGYQFPGVGRQLNEDSGAGVQSKRMKP